MIRVRLGARASLPSSTLTTTQDYGDLFWDTILRAAGHSGPLVASAKLVARLAVERVKLSSVPITDDDMSAALLDIYYQLLAARSGFPLRWLVLEVSDLLPAASHQKRLRIGAAPLKRLHVRCMYAVLAAYANQERVFLFGSGSSAVCVKVFPDKHIEDGRAMHEWCMLQQVAAYSTHFVHLRGWTEFDRKIAFITDYIAVKQRHFEPTSVHDALLYTAGLLKVFCCCCTLLLTSIRQ